MMTNIECDKISIKAYLREELKEYMRTIGDVTAEERINIRKWVLDGNSVYNNPYSLYEESGGLMDFIKGHRIGVDMCENPSNYLWGEFTADCNIGNDIPF
jgi:hypothetical protein